MKRVLSFSALLSCAHGAPIIDLASKNALEAQHTITASSIIQEGDIFINTETSPLYGNHDGKAAATLDAASDDSTVAVQLSVQSSVAVDKESGGNIDLKS